MRHQLATFRLDGQLYGVDVARVQEALRLHAHTSVPHSPSTVAGLVNLRGQVVLLLDLRARLGREPFGADDEPMMMVVKLDGEPVSLLVDQVGEVLEVDSDTMGTPPPTLDPELREVVKGVYTLDGDLLLHLDVTLAAQV
ncbi:chemotaxis protein CheW [Demequina aestuarii]|uniref:chemotaxis protein CheW n=1 Tax=Demequina aestuarii TaxID=327095 RepID=UPI0007842F87|nr:chemotaxis protein CheW [Demequina aestuarii]